MTTARTTHSAKDSASSQGLESMPVEPRQKRSTIKSTEAILEEIRRTTSSPSAESATEPDTEFSGTESLAFGMKLPIEQRRTWVALRLDNYRYMVIEYALSLQRVREEGKSVSDAEAQAIIETDGWTRAIPAEREFLAWMLQEK